MIPSKPRNIELFERVTTRTLIKLYENFPSPLDLDAHAVGAESTEDARDVEEAFETIVVYSWDSIMFLVREGFIHYESRADDRRRCTVHRAVLTMKGLTLLGRVPRVVDTNVDSRSLIEQLKSATENGARETVEKLLQSMFTSAVMLGVNSLGG